MSTNKIGHSFTPDSGVVVGIVGLGYVGLPTAIGFHASKFEVWGCDKSSKVIDALKSGLNPVGDHELDSMIPSYGTRGWNLSSSVEKIAPGPKASS